MPAPFGATVDGVRALVLDVTAEGARVSSRGPSRVADTQLLLWIAEGAARVNNRLFGYEKLFALPLVAAVEVEARALTQLYAAGLLWDVSHPERTGAKGTLGDALMARFDTGMVDLQAWFDVERAVAEARGAEDPSLPMMLDGVGAAYNFPNKRSSPNVFTRYTRF